MAIRDIFKKKTKEKIVPAEEIKEVKEEKAKKEIVSEKKSRRVKEKKSDIAWRILKTPQITEKATNLAEKNQYIFKVWPKTNKIEIKKAIEDLYGVDVISVKTIKIHSKKRRLGKISGWRQGYKKAMVRIKEGQKIEVMPR